MFYEAHDLLKTVSNPNVRSKIRNGYPGLKAYISDVKNPSKALAFQRDDGGVLSVNIMNFRNDKYLIFQLQDVQGKCKNYFVNKNGELLLVNQFIGGHIQSHISNGRYFSQDELDAFGYHKFFTEIKNCLAGYKEYVNKSVEQINK